MAEISRWIPGGILAFGCILNGIMAGHQVSAVELKAPIATIPPTVAGITGVDATFDPATEQATGMSSYIYRRYTASPTTPAFSVYAGYYDEQRQGKTIHSPKNCLPGAGWEQVEANPVTFTTSMGPVTVNRYKVIRPGEAAIVYYWYQGRGRVEHDEFKVKYQLLRDAALHGRTEEALLRIIIPIQQNDPAQADRLAELAVPQLVTEMHQILPS